MVSRRKKLSMSAFAVSLAASAMIAGCTGNKEGSSPGTASPKSTTAVETAKSTEPVTLSIFGVANSTIITKAFQDDEVITELQKRTGVKLDFTPDLNVTDRAEKLSVMLAGKDLPDIVVFNALTDRAKVNSAKAAMPLDDLVAKFGPDIKKNAGKSLEISKMLNSDETKSLYYLPGHVGNVMFSTNVNDNSWNLRWDLYKKLNYPKMDTLDDLLNVLEQMMKLEPTNKDDKKNYGLGLNLSDAWGQLMIDKAIANLQGFAQASSNDVYVDMSTGKPVPRVSDSNSIFWKSMQFYNKAYQRGILDPESATMKYNTISDKYKTGRYFASTTYWSLGGADAQFVANGQPEKGFVPFMVDYNKQNIYVGQATYNGDQFEMFISKNSKNPEAAMKFINYLFSYEGAELMMNGIEGKHYKIVNGVPLVTDEELAARKSDPKRYIQTGIGKYNNLLRFNPEKDPKGYLANFNNVPETQVKLLTQVQKDFMDYYKQKTVTEHFTKVPKYLFDTSLLGSLSTAPGSDIQAKEQQLDAYLIANIAKVIYQKTDADYEKAKTKFMEEYKAKGAVDVYNYYNGKYLELAQKVGQP
jgi:putative aldouronate transport system substrate-binding protein